MDDVGYFDEPFFSRGPISDAVDDVAAQGVHYFSSAGNGSSQQAYAAPLRIVGPAGATRGSNINLAGVDPALYAGGFQDFDAGPGTDIAQSMVLGGDPTSGDGGGDGILDLQWDDPVDPNGAPLGDPLINTTGEITAAQPIAKIPFSGTAGQTVRAIVDAIPSGSTDFILTLKDPSGNVMQEVDTGTSPEVVVQTLPSTGTYTFEVSGLRRRPRRLHVQGPARARQLAHHDRSERAVLRSGRQLPVRGAGPQPPERQAVRDHRLPRRAARSSS